ncbi:tetratricopeptide repeat protein [Halomonas cupida]|uniref:tetratricopeptide repeat protein n=1 Tax=Halomonas cupida TaxID=44933 RepID=UPI003A90255D
MIMTYSACCRAAVFFCCVFFLGCSDGSEGVVSGSDDGVVLEIHGDGRVYNNDPNVSIYDYAYDGEPIEKVVEDSERGDPYATYLLGVLYFNDHPEYGIVRDVSKGRELLANAWQLGAVDAGYSLFEVYSQGVGGEKDIEVAISYLQESAERGYVKSQFALAEDYSDRGLVDYLDEDYDLARKWFIAAAEQGDRESCVALSAMYLKGLGVEADEELAFEWISRIEEMKFGRERSGFRSIAWYYENGVGTDVDLVESYKYYDLLGSSGITDKERLSEKMTPEQIQEAIRLSGEWQREHNISMPNSEGYQYR